MNVKKYRVLFYFISVTILATIVVQFYWNYKNYEQNKQRVQNEIQLSLDNAVEEYYSSLAKSEFVTLINSSSNKLLKITSSKKIDSLKEKVNIKNSKFNITDVTITTDEKMSQEKIDSLLSETGSFMNSFNRKGDSLKKLTQRLDSPKVYTQFLDNKNGIHFDEDGKQTEVQYYKGKQAADSIRLLGNLKPIFISFLDKSVDYKELDSLIDNQLFEKGLNLQTKLHHFKKDTLFKKYKDTVLVNKELFVRSKSTYLKKGESFELFYSNPSLVVLKRGFGGILLSFILALLICLCLFYLLKIINQQKELASIKNDLISNITHEFKTPIATVSTAIEAIENFNVLDDKDRTKKYLSLSTIQLKKLHQMVEKLLETATLDSEKLLLKKESVDVVDLIEKIVKKHQLLTKEKELIFTANTNTVYANVDVFHFENVISNLVDNAVKYGGNTVEISINSILSTLEITVADDGDGIEKNQQEKIFDKFYRVPKGNTHDVKGFGIGLYYCKKIIEKHQGQINLISSKNQTIFKITISNE